MSDGYKWCRHRTPFCSDYPTCKVGVNYHQWLGKDDGMKGMPCIGDSAEARAKCPQYSALTAEEIADRDAKREAGFQRIVIIRKAITEAVKATGIRGGEMPCPCCKTGTVRYSQASCNNHVHARCSTPMCANWME